MNAVSNIVSFESGYGQCGSPPAPVLGQHHVELNAIADEPRDRAAHPPPEMRVKFVD